MKESGCKAVKSAFQLLLTNIFFTLAGLLDIKQDPLLLLVNLDLSLTRI
jgi:hypothetical protein